MLADRGGCALHFEESWLAVVNQPSCRNLMRPMIGLVFALAQKKKFGTMARTVRVEDEDEEGLKNLVQMLRWVCVQRAM